MESLKILISWENKDFYKTCQELVLSSKLSHIDIFSQSLVGLELGIERRTS